MQKLKDDRIQFWFAQICLAKSFSGYFEFQGCELFSNNVSLLKQFDIEFNKPTNMRFVSGHSEFSLLFLCSIF